MKSIHNTNTTGITRRSVLKSFGIGGFALVAAPATLSIVNLCALPSADTNQAFSVSVSGNLQMRKRKIKQHSQRDKVELAMQQHKVRLAMNPVPQHKARV